MSDKIEKFIASMSLAFPKRFEDERQQVEWFKTWERSLKNFDPWVVEAATARLIDNRTERSFPLPAEVRKVCMDVIRDERASKPELAVKPEDQRSNPFDLADQLVNCQIGRAAARANPSWIVPLHDFCRDNRRLPFSNEIERLKRIADDGEQIEYAIAIGKVTELTPALRESRERLRIRREKLRRALLGNEADAPVSSTFVPDPDWMDRERALYRAKMTERDRLAAEWRDKVTAEYGSVDRFLTIKRPPGNVAQNKRG